MCVDACTFGALTYEEREEAVPVASVEESKEKRGEMEIGLKSLVKKHWLKKVVETLTRVAKD